MFSASARRFERHLLLACGLAMIAATGHVTQGQSCQANAIVCENQLTGNLKSEWDVSGAGDSSLQGFATDISVNKGDTVHFKVKTTAATFQIDIYRLGYYGGRGARKVAALGSFARRTQPSCLTDAATGLVDCGNWLESASWTVPGTAVSGIYLARLSRASGGASHIVFVVRDDAGQADILVQTSDTTWQAYNQYGGNSLYVGSPDGRAYKVSYNRPITTRGTGPEDWLFNAEYPMVRWLEANGYNVSYFTGVDTDRYGASELFRHRIFLSMGHDEYWSGAQRANVEAARAGGVNLAFFSGNEVFWKTRWEPSIDGTNTPYRTLVTYKETHANAVIDPADPPTWTGTWRDKRFSPPADGGRPENALTGTIFTVNCCNAGQTIRVSQAFASQPFWRNTRVATLASGGSTTLSSNLLDYEWDENLNNGSRPAGLTTLSSTTLSVSSKLQDNGSTYAGGTATHSLVQYRHSSGALVFGAGTVQWSWGLDSNHDRSSSTPDLAVQQATVNLFADMGGVQPATLQAGLVPGTSSSDQVAPSSTITAPAAGASFPSGTAVTITGTASDVGGTVSFVQVSTDGGATWSTATGTATWSYVWTPGVAGPTTLKSRATDNSGNVEIPSAGKSVTVTSSGSDTTPPTVTAATPAAGASNVSTATTVTATFSEPVNPATVTSTTFTLQTSGAALVPATVSSSNGVATLRPGAPLAASTSYTATVKGGSGGIEDSAGNALVSDYVWAFTTAAAPPPVVSIWSASATPAAIATNDPSSVELGLKFRSDVNGTVTGVRFYKGTTNTGSHTGTLWSSTGTRLASATFTGETASGWQQVTFASAVAIAANTVYVVSYHANNGNYAYTSAYFASSGADNTPLHAPASGVSGGNGVYRYGSSAFPSSTYNSTNYWVDVVFRQP